MTTTMNDLTHDENEYSAGWALPVTPAELERYSIELNGTWGWDADEAAELADRTDVARITFGVYCDQERDSDICVRVIDVETFEVRFPPGPPARWYSSSPAYRAASGNTTRIATAANEARMWSLVLDRVDDVESVLAATLGDYAAAFDLDD